MNVQELIDQLQRVKEKDKDDVCPKGYLVEMIIINSNQDVQIIIDDGELFNY